VYVDFAILGWNSQSLVNEDIITMDRFQFQLHHILPFHICILAIDAYGILIVPRDFKTIFKSFAELYKRSLD
jgi:hypothetical protein